VAHFCRQDARSLVACVSQGIYGSSSLISQPVQSSLGLAVSMLASFALL
jgi:hypothetical protein